MLQTITTHNQTIVQAKTAKARSAAIQSLFDYITTLPYHTREQAWDLSINFYKFPF